MEIAIEHSAIFAVGFYKTCIAIVANRIPFSQSGGVSAVYFFEDVLIYHNVGGKHSVGIVLAVIYQVHKAVKFFGVGYLIDTINLLRKGFDGVIDAIFTMTVLVFGVVVTVAVEVLVNVLAFVFRIRIRIGQILTESHKISNFARMELVGRLA